MAKTANLDAVQVLRFFENESFEQAELLFRLVSEKMRERMRQECGPESPAGTAPASRGRRARRAESSNAPAPGGGNAG